MRRTHRTLLSWSIALPLMGGLAWWAYSPIRQARQEQLNNQLVRAAGLQEEATVIRLLDQGADPNASGNPESPYENEPEALSSTSQSVWQSLWDLLRGRKPPTEPSPYTGPRFPVLLIALGLGIYGADDCYHPKINPSTHRVEGTRAQTNIVKALVKQGADTRVRGRYGETPLTVAIMVNNAECIALMLEKGVNVNTIDRDRATPLHAAACMNDANTIRELLRRGADINAQNDAGWTPFMVGEYTTVEEMKAHLSGHPDLSLRNKEGETALSQAKKLKRTAIVRLLLEAGAKE